MSRPARLLLAFASLAILVPEAIRAGDPPAKAEKAGSITTNPFTVSAPSAERVRDLETTIAQRRRRRGKKRRLTAAGRAALNAQIAAMAAQSTNLSSSLMLECMDCGSLFSPHDVMSLPAGLNLSRGTKITVMPSNISC